MASPLDIIQGASGPSSNSVTFRGPAYNDALDAAMNAPIPQLGSVNPAMSGEQKAAYAGQVQASDFAIKQAKSLQAAYDQVSQDQEQQQLAQGAAAAQYKLDAQAQQQQVADGVANIVRNNGMGDGQQSDSLVAQASRMALDKAIRSAAAADAANQANSVEITDNPLAWLFKPQLVAQYQGDAANLATESKNLYAGVDSAINEASKQAAAFAATIPATSAAMADDQAKEALSVAAQNANQTHLQRIATDNQYNTQQLQQTLAKYNVLIEKGNQQFQRDSTAVSQSNQAKSFAFNALIDKARLYDTWAAKQEKKVQTDMAGQLFLSGFGYAGIKMGSPEAALAAAKNLTQEQRDNFMGLALNKGAYGNTPGSAVLTFIQMGRFNQNSPGDTANTAKTIQSIINSDTTPGGMQQLVQQGLKGGQHAIEADAALTPKLVSAIAQKLGNPSQAKGFDILAPKELMAAAQGPQKQYVNSFLSSLDPVVTKALQSYVGATANPTSDQVYQSILQNGKAAGYSPNKLATVAANYMAGAVQVRNRTTLNLGAFGMANDPVIASKANTYVVSNPGLFNGNTDRTKPADALKEIINNQLKTWQAGGRFGLGQTSLTGN